MSANINKKIHYNRHSLTNQTVTYCFDRPMDTRHAGQKYLELRARQGPGQGKWLLNQQHLPWQLRIGEEIICGAE